MCLNLTKEKSEQKFVQLINTTYNVCMYLCVRLCVTCIFQNIFYIKLIKSNSFMRKYHYLELFLFR